MAGKLIGFLIAAAFSTCTYASAESIDEFEQSGPDRPWVDTQALPQQSLTQGWQNAAFTQARNQTMAETKQKKTRTSKRTNTNLSMTLPPTWTPNNMTDLNVVDTGEPEPHVDEAYFIEQGYEAARLARENMEASDREKVGTEPY